MEIVSIKFKEQLIIQCNHQSIAILVDENRGNQGVALLIKAPSHISIYREEIALQKKKKGPTKLSGESNSQDLNLAGSQDFKS